MKKKKKITTRNKGGRQINNGKENRKNKKEENWLKNDNKIGKADTVEYFNHHQYFSLYIYLSI